MKEVFFTNAHIAHLIHRDLGYPIYHIWHQLWAVIFPF